MNFNQSFTHLEFFGPEFVQVFVGGVVTAQDSGFVEELARFHGARHLGLFFLARDFGLGHQRPPRGLVVHRQLQGAPELGVTRLLGPKLGLVEALFLIPVPQRGLGVFDVELLLLLFKSKALFLCTPLLFCPKGKLFTHSHAHSHASTNATRHHKYSARLSRLLSVPRVLVSFLKLCFIRK